MSDKNTLNIDYKAEHTPAKFHGSDSFVRGIMGPVGSGKSVACCIELVYRAMQQEPGHDGVRRFRAAAIRNSYPELKTTTIKTWQEWFPDEVCPINWGAPITAKMNLPAPPTEKFPDGTTMEFELWFLALDRPKDVKKLLSMELTMAWINEARELPLVILEGVTMRVGRYPAKRQGNLTFTGVILDTNPPDDDHWWYNIAEIKRPQGYKFWRQPGALVKSSDEGGQVVYLPNPEAENVTNQPLGYKYWTQMVHGKSQEWIKSYVLGQYATVYDGKPIYNEYNDAIHCAEEDLEVMRGLTLYIGLDFGRTPAAALFQLSTTGQVRVLDEIVSEDMGVRRFIRDLLKPKLNNEYGDMNIRLWGDPSGAYGAQTEESTCMTILEEEGLPTEPASTQEPIARREAVAEVLLKTDVDSEPGFILSPRCKFLRKGFNGAFMYERVQVVGEERYKDKPKKNIFSHVHEALQYGVLMIREGLKVEKVVARPVKRRNSGGWAA